jgi:hypothetical protein
MKLVSITCQVPLYSLRQGGPSTPSFSFFLFTTYATGTRPCSSCFLAELSTRLVGGSPDGLHAGSRKLRLLFILNLQVPEV